MAKISTGMIALCTVAVSTVYTLGLWTTKNSSNMVEASPKTPQTKSPARKPTVKVVKPKITKVIHRPVTILMKTGSKGQSVVALQMKLIALGLLPQGEDTGYYGPLTAAAVEQFQQYNGLVVTGTVTDSLLKTIASKANQSTPSLATTTQTTAVDAKTTTDDAQSSSNILTMGSQSQTVVELQNSLIALGLMPQGENTGYFGPLTTAAVKQFQQNSGLSVTGEVSASLLKAIESKANPAPSHTTSASTTVNQTQTPSNVLTIGSQSQAVVGLQNSLIALGLLPQGENTGYYGNLTTAAVKQFQQDQGLNVTGNVSPSLLTLIESSAKTSTAASPPSSGSTTSKTNNTTSSSTQSTPYYKDGTYNGYGSNGYGDLSVAVQIQSGKITSVQVTSYNMHYSQSYIDPTMPDEVIHSQSSNVDLVSGATMSSDNFISAVQQALQEAHS